MAKFHHKARAALLASLGGALGLNRLYLGQKFWWLPLAITICRMDTFSMPSRAKSRSAVSMRLLAVALTSLIGSVTFILGIRVSP